MSKRIGYVRVSTTDQNTERQLDGVTLDKTFTDKASGKDLHRPQLQATLDFIREGDTLIVHSIDRLARNASDLLRLVEDLTRKGVTVEFIKERLTFRGQSDDPIASLMLTMLAGFAQFERSLIRERQREGIAIAKADGKYKGRKKALTAEQIVDLQSRAQKGGTKAALAREFGVSRETLYQYLKSA